MYMSTSPNRIYSRSPERSPSEQRYPPFMRQTSFPCNLTTDPSSIMASQQQQQHNYTPSHHRKILPSPNVKTNTAQYQQQQQQQQINTDDMDYGQPIIPKPRMLRQATLPNPEQQVKLLPTSPPKRQTSPQFRRSPEFMRQQTLPNSEVFSCNSLSVHPPNAAGNSQAKFMPISPRQKQNFLFPNVTNRQFLSQQHVAAGIVDNSNVTRVGSNEQYSSSQSVNIHRDHSKMIKVRSHSNEEYSITKPAESRRLLPEIPTSRSSR